jgi:esterase/lipase superfamily enzyme
MAYDLGFDGTAMFYSWPSHGELSPIRYNEDGRNVDLSVAHSKRFLANVTEKTGAETVHVIAHSMGNALLAIGRRRSGQFD